MRSIWKWIIGIVVILLTAIMGGAWYLSKHWKPLLDTQIKQAVINATDSLYRISYDELNFNLITGHASIKNLRLSADTTRYANMHLQKRAPNNTYNIHIANLEVRRFYPRRILRERRLHIDDIIIDTPSVHVINNHHAYNDTVTRPRDDRTLYQRIAHILKEVSVSNLNFTDIQFKFSKKTDSTLNETVLNDLNVKVSDIMIDSVSQLDTTRFYYTRAIEVDVPGFRHETADSFYYVSFDRLKIATAYRQVELTGLKYAPRMSKAEFYKRQKAAKDMAVIAFPTIRLEDIDLHRFVERQQIHAGSLHIDSGTVAISNDLRYPKKVTDKVGKSPHQQLLRMKQPLIIDSVLLNNIHISYAEVGRKYGKEGKIFFDDVQGIFRNVTNDSLTLAQNQVMTADVTAYLMSTGKLQIGFAFDLLDPQGSYTYKGSLGPMNGRPLNSIIKPLLNAELASANIKGLRFDMQADDHRARGSMRFDYNKMQLKLLTTEPAAKRSSMRVASFLANSFIINDSNPDANGVYHSARVNYARARGDSFFRMLWQSLLQGIKTCAGVSPERERRLLQTAEEAKEASKKTDSFFKRVFRKRDRDKGEN
ncbi:hypothetical protein [Parapedobacter sp. DT-150]|uniref:hypothetical protein n=1 Tax=Parapedobacter sp. DT-150 TaxID=3396162 RepID=UPI003F19AA4B